MWFQRSGRRAYRQWGEDVTQLLRPSERLVMLWYLDRETWPQELPEAVKLLRNEAVADSDIDGRGEVSIVLAQMVKMQPVLAQHLLVELRPLLSDTDARAQIAAAQLAGNATVVEGAPVTDTVTMLLPLLSSADGNVRAAAAQALGQAGTANKAPIQLIVKALLPLLLDKDDHAQPAAVAALESLEKSNSIDSLELIRSLAPLLLVEDGNLPIQIPKLLNRIVVSLDKKGQQRPADPALVEEEVYVLLRLLNKDGKPPVPVLQELAGLSSLSEAAANEIVLTLLPLLEKDDWTPYVADILMHAVFTKKSFPQVSTSKLRILLNSQESQMRSDGVAILSKMGITNLIPITSTVTEILPLLKDEDPSVRSNVIDALSQVSVNPNAPIKEIVAELLPLLKANDPKLRINVVESLLLVAIADNAPITEILQNVQPFLTNNDVKLFDLPFWFNYRTTDYSILSVRRTKLLLLLLKDNNSSIRLFVVQKLSELYQNTDEFSDSVMYDLLPILHENNSEIRYAAIEALSQLNSKGKKLPAEIGQAILPLIDNMEVDSIYHDKTITILSNIDTNDTTITNEITKNLFHFFKTRIFTNVYRYL